MTKKDLIRIVAGNFETEYDFSYANEKDVEKGTNIPIKCKKHGVFFETPYHFLNSPIGCFECYKEKWWKDNGRGL